MDVAQLVALGILVVCGVGMWRQLRRLGDLVETAAGKGPELGKLPADVAAIRYQLKNLRRDVKTTGKSEEPAKGENGEAA